MQTLNYQTEKNSNNAPLNASICAIARIARLSQF